MTHYIFNYKDTSMNTGHIFRTAGLGANYQDYQNLQRTESFKPSDDFEEQILTAIWKIKGNNSNKLQLQKKLPKPRESVDENAQSVKNLVAKQLIRPAQKINQDDEMQVSTQNQSIKN